jgi:two-component system, NarL family, response regulator DevR
MTDSRPDGQSITVFLLDDSEMVRRELREMLSAEPDIRVVGDAGTAASALTQIRALHPDVAILDVRLPDSDGFAVCRQIRAQMPGTACLMLTAYYHDQAGQEAVRAGSAGYMLKKIRSAVPSAVRKVAAGQPVLDPEAMIGPGHGEP